jgi:hypothetical protein
MKIAKKLTFILHPTLSNHTIQSSSTLLSIPIRKIPINKKPAISVVPVPTYLKNSIKADQTYVAQPNLSIWQSGVSMRMIPAANNPQTKKVKTEWYVR